MKKQAKNRIEMIGESFQSWKVLSEAHAMNKKVFYNCLCTECDTVHIVDGRNLRNGMSRRCKDCGHKVGHNKQKKTIRTKRTSQESAFYYLFLGLRKNAAKRKKTWSLTEADVKTLVTSNCIYCGQVPSLVCNPIKWHGLSQKTTEGAVITRNGIDRVDSALGYEPGNVVPCCEDCNKSKLDGSREKFFAWLDKLARFQGYTR